MDSSSCIEQKGVIEEIEHGIAQVAITSYSACANCHSKGSCGASDSADRIVTVPIPDRSFHSGDVVEVVMKRSLGILAAFWAYIFPFILVMIILLLLSSFLKSELWVGLISIGVLAPYFLGIYVLRERLKKSFTFTLRKVS